MSKQENAKKSCEKLNSYCSGQTAHCFLSESKGPCQCTMCMTNIARIQFLPTSKEYYEDLILSQERIDSSTLCCTKKNFRHKTMDLLERMVNFELAITERQRQVKPQKSYL